MKKAICILYGAKNDIFGTVLFSQCCINHPTKIVFNLGKFGSNETHAIHIHEYGDTTDGLQVLDYIIIHMKLHMEVEMIQVEKDMQVI